MIKAVIIEDEPKNMKILQQMLIEHCTNVNVVATATNVKDGHKVITKLQPELVFLDVELSDGSGFDVLQQLVARNFQVIFTTAYEQYAIEAIKHSALDYLLKPIDVEELIEAVKKLSTKTHKTNANEQIENLLQSIKQHSDKKIALPTADGLLFARIDEIVRCEAQGSYTFFVLLNKEKVLVSKNIKAFEEVLPPNIFIRVHDSHIINLGCVRKYVKGRGGYIIMEDGSSVEVSARKRDKFLEFFNEG